MNWRFLGDSCTHYPFMFLGGDFAPSRVFRENILLTNLMGNSVWSPGAANMARNCFVVQTLRLEGRKAIYRRLQL